MTAKELIEQLQQLDQNLRVFTNGYEGGLEDAEVSGRIVHVALNVNTDWYYGPHQEVDEEDINDKTVKGIVL
jgi:hypothetical protein